MKKRLLNIIEHSYQKKWIIITDNTLRSLFPFVLILTSVQVLDSSFFAEFGFLKMILYPEQWFPFYQQVGHFLAQFSSFRTGILGWLAAYFGATYTMRYYGLRDQMISVSAILFYQIFYAQGLTTSLNINTFSELSFIGSANLLIGFLIGFFIGHIGYLSYYKFSLSHLSKKEINKMLIRQFQLLITVIIIAVSFNGIMTVLRKFGIYQWLYNIITQFLASFPDYVFTFFVTITHSLLALIGFSFPFFSQGFDDTIAVENLNIALSSNNLYQLPHRWTVMTLYQSYGIVGGVGNLLAILVIIIVFSRHIKMKQISYLSFFPSFLGNGIAAMTGLPIIFNIVYLIPFFITPLINELIAGVCIYLRLVPLSAFPVPFGTPGIFYAFIATGGSFRALALVIMLLIIDIIIYFPFVRYHEMLLIRYEKRREVLYD